MHRFAETFVLGLAWGSVYSLIALGYTMVYGVLRLINFAHGDVYMVGAFLTYYAILHLHLGFFPALALAMVGCGLLGLTIERGAYRPLRNQPRLTALITAIGLSLLLEYGGQLVFGPTPKAFPTEAFSGPVRSGLGWVSALASTRLGLPIAPEQLLIIAVSVVLLIGLSFIVRRTKIGAAMRAVSLDRATAALMGINVDRAIAFTFFLGSALAAAGGALVALNHPQIDPIMGLIPGLKAFVAAVLGGIGNIPGAMLGGLIMGEAEYLVAGYLSSTYRDAIAFALLILILLIRPTGLTGKGAVQQH